MEDKLTVVRARKEILAEKWHQKKHRETPEKKAGDKHRLPVDDDRQQRAVAVSQLLKAPLEGPLELHQRILRPAGVLFF
jgi:hypothetical protein